MERTSTTELVIRQRLAALARALPHARKGEMESVHLARVATRRLREALPLVASGKAEQKLSRAIRRLTRVLGPVRELDVATHALGHLVRVGDVPHAAAAALARAIAEERRPLQAEVQRELDRVDLDKLRAKAVAAARRGAKRTPRAERDRERIAAARARAARRAARLRNAVDAAAGIYLPERLHQVRIALKKLRYSMEIAREMTRSRAVARIRALKRLQDLLGRLHDLEMLIARTRALQASPKVADLRLSAELDRLVRTLETECRQLHAKYMTARPQLLAICHHVERAALPSRARAA